MDSLDDSYHLTEHQVTVTECSMRQSLLLSWNFGRQRLQPLFAEMKDDLEAALQRAVDNHAGHNEVLAEFDRFAAPLPSAPALNNIWTRLPFWAAAWPAREPATFHRLVVGDYLEHIADLAPKEIRHRESFESCNRGV